MAESPPFVHTPRNEAENTDQHLKPLPNSFFSRPARALNHSSPTAPAPPAPRTPSPARDRAFYQTLHSWRDPSCLTHRYHAKDRALSAPNRAVLYESPYNPNPAHHASFLTKSHFLTYIPNHTTPYHITTYHTLSDHKLFYHGMQHGIASPHSTRHHTISHRIAPFHII